MDPHDLTDGVAIATLMKQAELFESEQRHLARRADTADEQADAWGRCVGEMHILARLVRRVAALEEAVGALTTPASPPPEGPTPSVPLHERSADALEARTGQEGPTVYGPPYDAPAAEPAAPAPAAAEGLTEEWLATAEMYGAEPEYKGQCADLVPTLVREIRRLRARPAVDWEKFAAGVHRQMGVARWHGSAAAAAREAVLAEAAALGDPDA